MCAASGQTCLSLHPESTSMSRSSACSLQPGTTTAPLIALTHLHWGIHPLTNEMHLSLGTSLWPWHELCCVYAFYLADLTLDLPHHHGLVWQSVPLTLMTVTTSAPLVWVMWDCSLAGDIPVPACPTLTPGSWLACPWKAAPIEVLPDSPGFLVGALAPQLAIAQS